MNAEHINRLIALVKKTGHPVVLSDFDSDDGIVLMDLAEYEQLIGAGRADKLEPDDSRLAAKRQENFPTKDARREHRSDETLEVVLEKAKATAPAQVNVRHEQPSQPGANQGLTAKQPAVKINREIDSQPTNQGNRTKGNRPSSPPQNKSANQSNVQPPREPDADLAPDTGLDDEERFYLEPLE